MQELVSIFIVLYAVKILVNVFRGDSDGCSKCNCGSK